MSETHPNRPIRGRGATFNPHNRFESHQTIPEPEEEALPAKPAMRFIDEISKSIISRNDSPDIPFSASINPYRGCEHGCIYCYARPTHEFLGFSSGLDFESQIIVRKNAPELLRKELSSKKWLPQPITMSGVTDPYQPIERKLQITRQCLEILLSFKNPVSLITKNNLITRDIDLLSKMAAENLAAANISVTSLKPELTAILEPRTSRPELRLRTIEQLSSAGIPVNVMVAPIIPGLTDEEIPAIIDAVTAAGARSAAFTILRLPFSVAPLFENWLEQHFPLRKKRILDRIRSMRNGKLNNSDFGDRMRGDGIFAEQIRQLFTISTRRAGLSQSRPTLRTDLFQIPGSQTELNLF